MAKYIDEIFTVSAKKVIDYAVGFPMNIYTPVGNTEIKPVVIVLPAGNATINATQPIDWAKTFASRGYVGITASYKTGTYRGNPDEQKDAVENVWILLRYLIDHSTELSIDASKVFVMGISAGAITGIHSAIALNNRNMGYFNSSVSLAIPIKILASATIAGAATDIFLEYLEAGDPPNYFYHGMDDLTVTYSQAKKTFDKMIELGIPSTMMAFKDTGHKVGHKTEIEEDLVAKFELLL